jgi:hypothetical protein
MCFRVTGCHRKLDINGLYPPSDGHRSFTSNVRLMLVPAPYNSSVVVTKGIKPYYSFCNPPTASCSDPDFIQGQNPPAVPTDGTVEARLRRSEITC